jgi:hypothetical protein
LIMTSNFSIKQFGYLCIKGYNDVIAEQMMLEGTVVLLTWEVMKSVYRSGSTLAMLINAWRASTATVSTTFFLSKVKEGKANLNN